MNDDGEHLLRAHIGEYDRRRTPALSLSSGIALLMVGLGNDVNLHVNRFLETYDNFPESAAGILRADSVIPFFISSAQYKMHQNMAGKSISKPNSNNVL